jgi:uncharacterized RDD family membrane protein YckC
MEPQYAGFWRRAAAALIDALILVLVTAVVGAGLGVLLYSGPSDFRTVEALIRVFLFIAAWLYFARMESGPWQATLGKRVMGIQVTDLEGRPISFKRATGRHFGKIVSSIIFYIGFLMAAFTKKKQGLHDLMAGCLEVREAPAPPLAIPPAGR